ncbi:phage portal protein [Methylocystis rosea]|nr:phage portal protein [Methylocystis rosea]
MVKITQSDGASSGGTARLPDAAGNRALPTAVTHSFNVSPANAGIIDSIANPGERRLSFQNSAIGHGFFGPVWSFHGGPQARDATEAARLLQEIGVSNNLLATLVLNQTTVAVGPYGPTLSARPDAEALGITAEEARGLASKLEKAWRKWANNPQECDDSGRFNFAALAGVFYESFCKAGEGVAALTWRQRPGKRTMTAIQLLAPEQIDRTFTKEQDGVCYFQGIGFTDGRWTHVALRDIPLGQTYGRATETKTVSVRTSWGRTKIIHAGVATDPRSTRFLSPLAPAIASAHDRETIAEYSIARQLLSTSATLAISSDMPTPVVRDMVDATPDLPSVPSFEAWMDLKEARYGGGKTVAPKPAQVLHLLPNEKAEIIQADKRAGEEWDKFDFALGARAACAFGADVHQTVGRWENVSFSSSRMSTYLPHLITLRRREQVVFRFAQQVYECLVEELVNSGAIELPASVDFLEHKDDICNAKWSGPAKVQPDESKQARADETLLSLGAKSLQEVYSERGIDFEQAVDALQAEIAYMNARGIRHPMQVAQGRANESANTGGGN